MTVWSRIAASIVRLPPPQTSDVSVERDLVAKMPDHDLWMTFFRDSENNLMGLMSEAKK